MWRSTAAQSHVGGDDARARAARNVDQALLPAPGSLLFIMANHVWMKTKLCVGRAARGKSETREFHWLVFAILPSTDAPHPALAFDLRCIAQLPCTLHTFFDAGAVSRCAAVTLWRNPRVDPDEQPCDVLALKNLPADLTMSALRRELVCLDLGLSGFFFFFLC
jgi:hypothetical protein